MTMRDASEVIAALAQEIRRVDGDHKLGAAALAEVLAPFIASLPASTPPGDDCVRHACKRVRMEMQARIDALAEALLTDAQCDRIIDSLDSLAQDVCQYEYGLPVYDHMPAMRAAIRAAIKGDSHAG